MHVAYLMRLTGIFIAVTGVLSAGQGKIQNVSGKVAETVTLQTGVSGLQGDSQILWSDDSDKSVLVNYNEGKLKLDYVERFRGRLQLDPGSGSLTVKNLNIDDTGLYLGQIINGAGSTHRFNLTVLESDADPEPPTSAAPPSTAPAPRTHLAVSLTVVCFAVAVIVLLLLYCAVKHEKIGGNCLSSASRTNRPGDRGVV
ncbi:CD48 antigen-like [Centroberyx affinis]|uniref:CD48 antigen-like n=1 Tax=Centroberyx affinis TaxID=166261 RepID=UPI003A5BA01C